MIHANELRIGSKFSGAGMIQTVKEILDYGPEGSIQAGNKTAVEVTPEYSHLILVKECGNQYKPVDMEGIPLTPELLVKAGFSVDQDLITPVLDVYFIYLKLGRLFVGVYKGNYTFYFGEFGNYGRVITSLHQLQNIAYSLTGTELTINL